jgi:hypothetical protein
MKLIPLHWGKHDSYFILLEYTSFSTPYHVLEKLKGGSECGGRMATARFLGAPWSPCPGPRSTLAIFCLGPTLLRSAILIYMCMDCIVMVLNIFVINLSIWYRQFEWTTRRTRMSLRIAPFRTNKSINFAVLQSPPSREESNKNSKDVGTRK